MNFQNFSKSLICKVQIYLGPGYDVELREVTKNNNHKLTGIMAKTKDNNIFPTIYINDFYNENANTDDIDYIAMKIAHNLKNAKIPEADKIYSFMDFEKAKNNIVIKLINAECNKELLLDIPHKRFHNLAICYYYQTYDEDENNGKASITIRNEHINNWGIDKEVLHTIAVDNSRKLLPDIFISITDMINEMYEEKLITDNIPMYVLTNKDKLFGASVILYPGIYEKIAKLFNSSFYVIPSSVHELIVIPADEISDDKVLLDIVTQINHTQVSAWEILADSVYFYDIYEKELIWKY